MDSISSLYHWILNNFNRKIIKKQRIVYNYVMIKEGAFSNYFLPN